MVHTATDYGLGWLMGIFPFEDLFFVIAGVLLVIHFAATMLTPASAGRRFRLGGWLCLTISLIFWVIFHSSLLLFVVYAFSITTLVIGELVFAPLAVGIVLLLVSTFMPKKPAKVDGVSMVPPATKLAPRRHG